MRIQKVSAGRGAAWVNESIGLLKSGGKSIWAPAVFVGILASIPYVGSALGLVMIIFYGSLVLCFDKPNAGYTAFSGFSDGGFGRMLPLIVLNFGFAILAMVAIWPSIQPVFEAAISGAEPSAEQLMAMFTSLAKHLLWLLPVGILLSWIIQFAVPLTSLKRLSGGAAIKVALSAVVANVPALIVNFLCLIAVVILAIIVLMIPIALISAAFSGSPMLVNLLLIPLTAVLTAIVLALMSGNMLYGYRDVFGEDAEPVTESKNSEVLL